MKTFVIGTGLDDKTAKYVESLSAHFETVSPVNARNSSRWKNRGFMEEFEIGVGAAGCLLAHEKTWGMAVSTEATEDEIFLILEDDSFLTTYGEKWFSSVVERTASGRLDLVHLGRTRIGASRKSGWEPLSEAKKVADRLALSFPPLFFQGFAWRTHAYLMSKRFARNLLSKKLDFSRPIDEHLREIAAFPKSTRTFRVVTSFQGLFLQTDRESLVEKRGR